MADGLLSIAGSGLDAISARLAIVSQNVANANTAGFTRKSVSITSETAGGVGIGVRSGVATRSVDQFLQADVFAASGELANQQVTSGALSAIDAASGTPGSGTDLSSLVGALRDAFSTLSTDPSNQTQQRQVVDRAGALVRGVNGLARTVGDARQAAQDNAVEDVRAANSALRQVSELSTQITAAASRGQSTADLEDSRDGALQTLSNLTGAKFLRQANGEVLGVTGGLVLPLGSSSGPFSLAPATIGAGTTPTSSPRLLLNGLDVTGQLTGGQLGAHLALRDSVLPSIQSGLDGFAQSLASSFQSNGLTLFTDGSGAVPGSVTPGLSTAIQVAATAQATPSTVRDGSGPPGAAGAPGLIDTVLTKVLNNATGGLSDQAQELTASNAALASSASARLTTAQGVSTSLTTKLASSVGVSVDSELTDLVRLQTAYAANAKVITASQTIWTALLDAVR